MIPHIRAVSFFTSICSFIFNDGYTVLFHFAVNLTWYFWGFNFWQSRFKMIWTYLGLRQNWVLMGPWWSRRMDRSGSPAFWYGSGVWIGLWVQGMDRGFTFWLAAICFGPAWMAHLKGIINKYTTQWRTQPFNITKTYKILPIYVICSSLPTKTIRKENE
jgi:hypothetical protein